MNNKETEKIIEFEKIKQLWLTFAKTDNARAQIRQIQPYLSETELTARLRETGEGKELIENVGIHR